MKMKIVFCFLQPLFRNNEVLSWLNLPSQKVYKLISASV